MLKFNSKLSTFKQYKPYYFNNWIYLILHIQNYNILIYKIFNKKQF